MNLIPDGKYFQEVEPGEEKVFLNYFRTDAYLNWFQGSKDYEFAERLVTSQMFATFCDDYFDKDVSNMLIYMNIN